MTCVAEISSERVKRIAAEGRRLPPCDDEIAKNESPITAEELLGEIAPLIEEYFLGEVRFDGKEIVYRLPNGQKFRLSAIRTK